MWRRETLKSHAKLFLKEHYMTAFLVCLVAIILGASSESPEFLGRIAPGNGMFGGIFDSIRRGDPSTGSNIIAPLRYLLTSFIGIASISLALIFVALRIVVGNNIKVGRARYFSHAIGGDSQFEYVFSTFKRGEWGQMALKLLYVDVIIFLWGLLLIIPGIIKSYQYRFVPFILADNPQLSARQAMDISTTMTDNDKINLFVLDLSFFGWRLLSMLIPLVGPFLLEPYPKATEATLYRLKVANPSILGE